MFCGGMELRLHLKLFNDDTTFRHCLAWPCLRRPVLVYG